MSTAKIGFGFGPGEDSTRPAQAHMRTGYDGGEIPTNDERNWLWGHGLPMYVSLQAAATQMLAGQSAIIVEPAPEKPRMELLSQSYAGAGLTTPNLSVATGRYVLVAGHTTAGILALNREDMTLSHTIATGYIPTSMVTDGETVYSANGSTITAYTIATGVQVWTKASAGRLCKATDGTHLYCISGIGVGNTVEALGTADGVAVWSGWTVAAQEVWSLYSNGQQLFVGSVNVIPAGNLYSVEALTGKGNAGDGGIGTSTETWAWSLVGTNVEASAQSMIVAFGPHKIAVSGANSATTLEVFSRATGTSLATYAGAAAVRITSDQTYLYAIGGLTIGAFDESLNLVYGAKAVTSSTAVGTICADVSGVFSMSDQGATWQGNTFTRPDQKAVKVYRRDPATDPYWPLGHLLLSPLL